MLAIVDAEMSISPSAPRCSRSGASGALVSENGTEAASLMSTPYLRPPNRRHLPELSGAVLPVGRPSGQCDQPVTAGPGRVINGSVKSSKWLGQAGRNARP